MNGISELIWLLIGAAVLVIGWRTGYLQMIVGALWRKGKVKFAAQHMQALEVQDSHERSQLLIEHADIAEQVEQGEQALKLAEKRLEDAYLVAERSDNPVLRRGAEQCIATLEPQAKRLKAALPMDESRAEELLNEIQLANIKTNTASILRQVGAYYAGFTQTSRVPVASRTSKVASFVDELGRDVDRVLAAPQPLRDELTEEAERIRAVGKDEA